jgi:flagellar biosynthesis protein FlhG
VRIVPASSGISSMTDLSTRERAGLISAFSDLTLPVDTLIVDTGAGIDSTVLSFSSACQSIIVVICDEPTSITDAYALIKVLNKECGVKKFQLLANMVDNESQGRLLYGKLCRVAERFLDVSLTYLGAIPRDIYLRKAVQQQSAVVEVYPRCPSAQALMKLADSIDVDSGPYQGTGGMGFFMERLMHQGVKELEIR